LGAPNEKRFYVGLFHVCHLFLFGVETGMTQEIQQGDAHRGPCGEDTFKVNARSSSGDWSLSPTLLLTHCEMSDNLGYLSEWCSLPSKTL
jgi:hypothetical protein